MTTSEVESGSGGLHAVPYPASDRRADLRRGTRDGGLRVPSYTHLSAVVEKHQCFTTPYTMELWDIGRSRMQAERIDYERRIASDRQQLASLRAQLEAANADVARGRSALVAAEAALTADELRPRNPQEAARSPEELRARRTAMRDRRIQAEQERQTDRLKTVNALEQRIAEVCRGMDTEFVRAKERAGQFAEHATLRIATYWGAVAAAHPDGRQLALLLPQIHCPPPTWVSARSMCGDLRPASDVVPDDPRPDIADADGETGEGERADGDPSDDGKFAGEHEPDPDSQP